MQERTYVRLFLLVPALIVLYFVLQIFQPFLKAIALAVILASLCYPAFGWILVRLRGRRSLAALITCLLVLLVVVGPVIGFIVSLAHEVGEVYLTFQNRLAEGHFEDLADLQESSLLKPLLDWVGRYVSLEGFDLVSGLASLLQSISIFFLRHSTAIVGGFANLITDFFIMVVTMFFLFRDGSRIGRELSTITPLSSRYEQALAIKFKEITRATVVGSLLTALAQGVAGGLVFWIVGFSNLIFWSASMAFLSLVPVVGPSLVWAPWAVYFLLSGSVWKGVILILAGVLFIGMLDNILRPLFIEGQSGMHTLLVFFAIMGGIAYFGMIGIIFGPILVSLGLTFVELYRLEFQSELKKPLE